MADTAHVPVLFYLVAFVAVAIFVFNMRRLLAVRKGREELHRQTRLLDNVVNGLLFGVGQRRVQDRRFSYASVMHFLLGWGFIELLFATTVDFLVARGLLVEILPGMDTPWFAAINDLGGLFLVVGLMMAIFRRHLNKPEPLPQASFKGRGNLLGDTGILLLLLLLDVGGFLAEAARLGAVQPTTARYSFIGYPISLLAGSETWQGLVSTLWWTHAIMSLAFIALLPTTKMFHAVAAVANVALTDRTRRGQVRPMHVTQLMEDPEADLDNLVLGADRAESFTWKQLLDAVACTECARCTTVCPAYATGKPLSPMKLITDMRHDLYAAKEEAGDQGLLGGRVSEDEIWSCTTCNACMDACPVLIDHVPTFTDMRRFLVLSEGKPPQQAAEGLEGMLNRGNPWSLPPGDRLNWATQADLDVPVFADKGEADVLYWVGCAGAYDPRNQEIARSMVKILNTAGVDFAVLGLEETCTGDSARRLGEEYLFETLAARNIETLNKYKFKSIVTPCPHCFHVLSSEYPAFGGNYRVQHHTSFIDELLQQGRIEVKSQVSRSVTFHDPCYLGRHNRIFDAPRNLLRTSLGAQGSVTEMKFSKESSFCCGAGGGNMWYEMEQGERINLTRLRQAAATGASTVATACSFCTIMMEDAVKVDGMEESIEVRDVAEIVAETL